jgi:hypothetical protein
MMRETKKAILARLRQGPAPWSELLALTKVSEPALLTNLNELASRGWVCKDERGLWTLGRGFEEFHEDQLAVTKIEKAIAVRRCYDLFFDLEYLLSRPHPNQVDDEDKLRCNDMIARLRLLLAKYTDTDVKELMKKEQEAHRITAAEIVTGAIVWGKWIVTKGLRERYLYALTLLKRLPAEDEVTILLIEALELFRAVSAKLGVERLKDLPSPSHPA